MSYYDKKVKYTYDFNAFKILLAAEVLQETTSETYLEKPARALYFRQIKRGRGCQYFIHSWISMQKRLLYC